MVKNILIKIYYFMTIIKYYHSLFCSIYNIMTTKLLKIKLKIGLQILF